MKKTIQACLLLLCVLPPHRAEAQLPPAEGGQPPSAAEKRPAEDPLQRGTPQGAAAGLIRAAEQGNLDRAADYLDSRLPLPERRELARKLWVVLDRRLVGGPGRLTDTPDGDLGDGVSNRDRMGTVEGESGGVDVFLDRVPRGQGDPIWLISATTLQEIPRLFDEIEPPWIEGYLSEPLRTMRLWGVPLYRWIVILLFIPLAFVGAALSTRGLSRIARPALRRFTRRSRSQAGGRGASPRARALGLSSTPRRSGASPCPPGTSGSGCPAP